jgi:hypothetical protein
MAGVYLIKQNGLTPIKIGMTSKNSAQQRVKMMMTSSPFGYEVVYFLSTNKAKKLEKKLHEKYKEKRINREWFNLNEHEITNLISTLETFNLLKDGCLDLHAINKARENLEKFLL